MFVLGDLSASEMTMTEDDRIQLMILVKEGKLSVQEAVETVRNVVFDVFMYTGHRGFSC
jgi:hypothetical protein